MDPLAERELATGRVRPLATVARDATCIGHRLVYPRLLRQRRSLELFTTRLKAELGLK